jgi:predicted HTH transcriptional regulator
MFKLSEKLKAEIANFLATKKFNDVFFHMKSLDAAELTEDQVNNLVGFIGEYQYNEVLHIFTLISEPGSVTPSTLPTAPVTIDEKTVTPMQVDKSEEKTDLGTVALEMNTNE